MSLFVLVSLAAAQERTINVAGEGVVSGAPDLATINTGVTTNAKTAGKALIDNTKLFVQVLKVLEDNGIDKKDVQTSFFDVSQRFKGRGQQNRIVGYTVTNEVLVKVRDLDILGAVLDALVKAGSNSISGITFSIDDSKKITDEARVLAIQDAKSRAQLYAKAAGVKLGKVLAISEKNIDQSARGESFDLAFAAASVPVASGELDVTATVFILFAIA